MGKTKANIDGLDYYIVPDGPVCPNAYRNAEVRILHVLKEATKPDGLAQNLQNFIRPDGTVKYRLWKVTARRSYALQNGLPEWIQLSADVLGVALRSSAIINVNDTIPVGEDARFRTDDNAFWRFAQLRWPERRKVLEMLMPNVVVCGGTFSLVRQLLEEHGEECISGDGFFLWRNVPFISAYHPSFTSKKHDAEYAEFCNVCRKALGLRR